MAWVDFCIVLFLGFLGVHKFLQKNTKMGFIYLFTGGLCGIGWIYDIIVYLIAALKGERVTKYKGKRLDDDEPLPIIEITNLMLQGDEVCHYSGEAKYQTSKKVVTGYTGKGNGFSFRIAKGVSYRTGGHSSKAIRENVVEQTSGTLTVTNKRVVFSASKGAFDTKINKISSINPYTDGIIIQIGSKSYTLICKNSIYIYQIIQRVSRQITN